MLPACFILFTILKNKTLRHLRQMEQPEQKKWLILYGNSQFMALDRCRIYGRILAIFLNTKSNSNFKKSNSNFKKYLEKIRNILYNQSL